MVRNKHKRGKLGFIRAAALVCTLLFVILDISNNLIVVTRLNVGSESERKGIRIALLSDLHNRFFGDYGSMIISKLRVLCPDMIVLCGDMVNAGQKDFELFERFLAGLKRLNVPTYMVYGNHELLLSDSAESEFRKVIERSDVVLLENEHCIVECKGIRCAIYGLTQKLYYYSGVGEDGEALYGYEAADMAEALGNSNSSTYNILVTHNPLFFDTYAKWGANLTLCGHIHGGLLRLPYLGGVFSPNLELFPKYDAGLYSINQNGAASYLAISRGMSQSPRQLRIFDCPEICLVCV